MKLEPLTISELSSRLPVFRAYGFGVTKLNLTNILKLGGFLAGGAIRDLHTGTSIKDYDIFCPSQEVFDEIEKLFTTNGYWGEETSQGNSKSFVVDFCRIDLVCKNFGTVEEIIDGFDCGASKAALYYDTDSDQCEVYYHEEFISSIQTGVTTFTKDSLPLDTTLERMTRMMLRGFAIKEEQLELVFDRFCNKCGCDAPLSSLYTQDELMNSANSPNDQFKYLASYDEGLLKRAYLIHYTLHESKMELNDEWRDIRVEPWGATYIQSRPEEVAESIDRLKEFPTPISTRLFTNRDIITISNALMKVKERFGAGPANELHKVLANSNETEYDTIEYVQVLQRIIGLNDDSGFNAEFYAPIIANSFIGKTQFPIKWIHWINFFDSDLVSEEIDAIFLPALFN